MNASTLTGTYRGRFAPTPSGPLHAGSLLTALASWLDARQARGRWLLRIDDLDRARCRPDAESSILRQLEAHGLTWDETPRRQSLHLNEYARVLADIERRGLSYGCRCTRAMLQRQARHGVDGPVYAGTCRSLGLNGERLAIRFRMPEYGARLALNDRIQGMVYRDAEADIGDWVLRRSDGIYGYHLSCVVDEAAMQITHIVRGADLLASSFAQRSLQTTLGLSSPVCAHVPLRYDASGRKLSKQNHAESLDPRRCGSNLFEALTDLGQSPPGVLRGAAPRDLLDWAVPNWRLEAVPRQPVVGSASSSAALASGILD